MAALSGGARDHVVPMSPAETLRLLTDLVGDLDAVARGAAPVARVAEAGARLARAHFVGDAVLGRSIAVLTRHFTDPDVVSAVPAVDIVSHFANGYLRAFRAWLLAEQESLRSAEIAARRETEEQLRASEARMRGVFTQAGIGTGLSDMTGRIIEVNTAFAQLLGYTPEQFREFAVDALDHPDDEPGMWDRYRELIRGECDYIQMEKPYRHRDGHTVWTNINVSLIRDEAGNPQYTLILVEDISERRALREHLDYRANHDDLTGLPNRSRFLEALDTAISEPDTRFGLCYFDLDHFKSINDTFGHAAGDQVLVQTAARLIACTTGNQLVARMSGDEFVILVPEIDGPECLVELAATVLDVFREPFDIGGTTLQVTASMGVMERRPEHISADQLLNAADTSMYWAKSDGRGRYAIFDPARGQREHIRAELCSALPAALTGGEFFLDYQPILMLDGERTVALEALVRWRHPVRGTLCPSLFIDLAESSGHILALTEFVLAQACRDHRFAEARTDTRVPLMSVNVSAADIADPTFLDRVRAVLDATGMDPAALQLELTEHTVMDTAQRPVRTLRELADLGVRIAVDDFGTGYSNLAYLSRLPLHTIKLAGPFLEHIRTPEASSAADLLILEKIIELAHGLGIQVTAECVETCHQAQRLRDLGCDTAQGRFFHPPMPIDEIAGLLTREAADAPSSDTAAAP